MLVEDNLSEAPQRQQQPPQTLTPIGGRSTMALYDDLIARLNDPARRLTVNDRQEAAACITLLQADIRGYNPDDAIFDDESDLRPMTGADAASVLARLTDN